MVIEGPVNYEDIPVSSGVCLANCVCLINIVDLVVLALTAWSEQVLALVQLTLAHRHARGCLTSRDLLRAQELLHSTFLLNDLPVDNLLRLWLLWGDL